MSQENVEITRRGLEAFNRRDPEGFAALCTQEVEIVPLRAAMEDMTYRGPDAVRQFFTDSDEAWEHLRIDQEEIRDLGETVLAVGTLHARGRASGAEVEMRPAWVFEFDDGLITAARTYLSREAALEAAGLSE